MRTNHRTLSDVRAKSPFATPPHILVVATDDHAEEAVTLAEALDAYGAEAEVRLTEDTRDDHSHPDAVIVADSTSRYHATRHHPVLVAVTDDRGEQRRARAAGFDLIVSKSVSAESLMEQLGNYLPRIKL